MDAKRRTYLINERSRAVAQLQDASLPPVAQDSLRDFIRIIDRKLNDDIIFTYPTGCEIRLRPTKPARGAYRAYNVERDGSVVGTITQPAPHEDWRVSAPGYTRYPRRLAWAEDAADWFAAH